MMPLLFIINYFIATSRDMPPYWFYFLSISRLYFGLWINQPLFWADREKSVPFTSLPQKTSLYFWLVGFFIYLPRSIETCLFLISDIWCNGNVISTLCRSFFSIASYVIRKYRRGIIGSVFGVKLERVTNFPKFPIVNRPIAHEIRDLNTHRLESRAVMHNSRPVDRMRNTLTALKKTALTQTNNFSTYFSGNHK